MGECFIVEGHIPGVFPSSRVFELWVFDDGTLSGAILNEEHDKEVSDAKLMHGTAVRHGDKQDADSREPVFQVKFQLVRPWNHLRVLEGGVRLIPVEGTLTRSAGLRGRWLDDNSIFEFVLSILSRHPRSKERDVGADRALYPLTPGLYSLKGAAVSSSRRLYPTTCVLKIRAGGELEGSATDSGRAKRLDGSWTPAALRFTLYGYGKEYVYYGEVYAHAIRGQWKPAEVEFPSSGEHGTFDFEVVASCRQWSHSSHKHHPKVFRDIVRLCLLSSMKESEATGESNVAALPRLPSHLWSEVFSYCEYDWFALPPELKVLAPDTPASPELPESRTNVLQDIVQPIVFVVLLWFFLTLMD